MKTHIGWVKYCNTYTTLSDPKSDKVVSWPCNTVFYKAKPSLDSRESPEQFFWKKCTLRPHNENNKNTFRKV